MLPKNKYTQVSSYIELTYLFNVHDCNVRRFCKRLDVDPDELVQIFYCHGSLDRVHFRFYSKLKYEDRNDTEKKLINTYWDNYIKNCY